MMLYVILKILNIRFIKKTYNQRILNFKWNLNQSNNLYYNKF